LVFIKGASGAGKTTLMSVLAHKFTREFGNPLIQDTINKFMLKGYLANPPSWKMGRGGGFHKNSLNYSGTFIELY